jgi:hypothetical protein
VRKTHQPCPCPEDDDDAGFDANEAAATVTAKSIDTSGPVENRRPRRSNKTSGTRRLEPTDSTGTGSRATCTMVRTSTSTASVCSLFSSAITTMDWPRVAAHSK